MDTESGTVPPPDQDTDTRPAPEGWVWEAVASEGYLWCRPDTRHPLHPSQQTPSHVLARLARDPEIAEAIETLRPFANQTCAHLDTLDEATRSGDRELVDQISGVVADLAEELMRQIDAACFVLGPKDIKALSKYDYMVRDLFPRRHVDRRLVPAETVQLSATESGEIFMQFTGASLNDRKGYEPLIAKAQEFFGHRGNEGGRPRLTDNPAAAEQVRLAARLAHWGAYTNEMIAELFGWLPLEDQGVISQETLQARRKKQVDKASSYVTKGEQIFEQEMGPKWREQVPPQLTGRALTIAKVRGTKRRRARPPQRG